MRRAAAALVLAALPAIAAASEVYRCPDAQGRTTYSDRPCAGAGKRLEISTPQGISDIATFGPGFPPPTIGRTYTTGKTAGCLTTGPLKRVIELGDDPVAMKKHIDTTVVNGSCVQIQEGTRVVVTAYTKDLTQVRVRPIGDPTEYWTFIIGIH